MNLELKELDKTQSKNNLTEVDVFGGIENGINKEGMVVTRKYGDKCAVFKDMIGFKEITLVCKENQYEEVCYWLRYIGHEIVKEKKLKEKKIALRSRYSLM